MYSAINTEVLEKKSVERINISEILREPEGYLQVITSEKESSLVDQDAPAKHTDECIDMFIGY